MSGRMTREFRDLLAAAIHWMPGAQASSLEERDAARRRIGVLAWAAHAGIADMPEAARQLVMAGIDISLGKLSEISARTISAAIDAWWSNGRATPAKIGE